MIYKPQPPAVRLQKEQQKTIEDELTKRGKKFVSAHVIAGKLRILYSRPLASGGTTDGACSIEQLIPGARFINV
jgi:hypothetical protein